MPGLHHVEARAFKDALPRFKTMKGFHVPCRGWWDCHGLPVELEVERAVRNHRGAAGRDNHRCRRVLIDAAIYPNVHESAVAPGRISRGVPSEDDRRLVAAWSAMRDPPASQARLQRTVTVTDIHDEHTFVEELERQLEGARHMVWMWSPWIANRARQVVPLIKAAVDRGVQVTVFLRPDEDRNMAKERAQRRLPELRDSRATVIRSDHEHRKLVIIDDRRVLIGSVNALSKTPGRPARS